MDHYNTLGVPRSATPEEIKKAYRKLAMEHHPDRGGNQDEFYRVQVAYDTLGDPQKRAAYDNPMPQNPFGGFSQHPGGFSFNVNGFDLNDLFGAAFGQHRPNSFQNQNTQRQIFRTQVRVSLVDVYNGADQMLQLGTPNGIKTIAIKIPPGIQSGTSIRYENLIEDGSLIIEFIIQPDLIFTREGDNLYSNVPISVLDLIIGTTIEFTTIAGITLQVSIPPNTQPYQQIKLGRHGMPSTNGGKGDQILLLKPYIPANIDTEIVDVIKRHQPN
jgi:DnaJ-class molecular chaperone